MVVNLCIRVAICLYIIIYNSLYLSVHINVCINMAASLYAIVHVNLYITTEFNLYSNLLICINGPINLYISSVRCILYSM